MTADRYRRIRIPAIVQFIVAAVFAVAYGCGAYASPAWSLPMAESGTAGGTLCHDAADALVSEHPSCAENQESCTDCGSEALTVSRPSVKADTALVAPEPPRRQFAVRAPDPATPILVGSPRMESAPPSGALTPIALKTVLLN